MSTNDVKSDLRSKVYNALSDAYYEVFENKNKDISVDDQKKMLEESFEWFIIHFFDK